MSETSPGSAGASDDGGYRSSSGGECSPLQTRAAFLQNWDWQSVLSINQRACQRSGSQHGINPETGTACATEWQAKHVTFSSLLETFDLLRHFHRSAPFLFLNGNTFSYIGRELALALFSDLPALRKRETASAIAHYIAGVLDREAMIQAVDSLCASASFQPGDRVQTLRGTTQGVILRVLDDGRIVWQPEGTDTELTSLPESLRPR